MSEETLPDGWKRIAFGEIATRYYSGGTPASGNAEYWGEGKPWTTSASIEEDAFILSSGSRLITERGVAESASSVVPKGGLLVGTRVGVGKAVVAVTDIAISQDLTGVSLAAEADALFLAFHFKGQALQAYFEGRKRGAIIKGISRQDLSDASILLPPLDVQRAIASVLWSVQDARDARRAERAVEAERRAWLLDRLFTHGTRGEPVKDTEIGPIPKGWATVELGDVASVTYGLTVNQLRHISSHRRPYLRVANVCREGLRLDEVKEIGVLKGDERFALQRGDVLLVEGNGNPSLLGAAAIWKEEIPDALHQNHLIRARADGRKLLPEMLVRFLNSKEGRGQIVGRSKTSNGLHTINSKIVKELRIPLPPLDEQAEIAEVLAACDAKLDALDAEAARLDELFRSLLDELMTGRRSAHALIAHSAA